ncbi:hypothetical protein NLJ89_g1728 [Agrocybe chaxingu]|uniref:Uncharacterized protein n=1 Tax=Agrocybe chaxingu TaxID=84603 RepID=A0A9W8TCW8_9AGAR|nr:hypothetical protein NLJ89_g1728 [Agrocybe chaxingu]
MDSHGPPIQQDLAIELECEAFKWRWEICFLGHKWASEIISKHLIFPLISLNHLTFSTAEVVGEIPDGDVEKAVDKLGRTARRTLDTHIKNAMSKPRIATIIRRITAMFNFVPDLPPVSSTIGKVELKIDQYEPEERAPPRIAQEVFEEKRDSASKPIPERAASKRERSVEMKNAEPASSETEESDAVPPPAVATKFATSSAVAGPSRTAQGSPLPERHVDTPPPASKPKAEPSDSDSSPHRPVKKAKSKVPPSSDDDSEQDNKTKSARGASAGGIKRGARQPLKRGGKRF